MCFSAIPIIALTLFDYEYNLKQSFSITNKEIYLPGINNELFNQNVYFTTIGRGFAYGVLSLVSVFILLEYNILDADGRTGYFLQSGSVLYFNIIVIINLRLFVMENGLTPFMLFSILITIASYWFIYWVYIETVET